MFDTGGVAGEVARAHTLLADIAASISSETTGAAASEALREALCADNQLSLLIVLLTNRVDRSGEFARDGAMSMAAWLRAEAHCSTSWASARVKTGRLLVDSLPATRTAWAAGQLNFEHVQVIARAAAGLDDGQLEQLDRALAAAAPDATPPMLRDIAAAVLERIAPDTAEKDRDDKTATQSVQLSDVPDGGYLTGTLDVETTALLRAALKKFTSDAAPFRDEQGLVQPGPTLAHRQALAVAEMCRQALDFGTGNAPGANKPHLVITVTETDLRNGIGVGYLPGGGTLPAADLRRIACDCKIIPVLLSSAGMPLDVGRTTRSISAAQRTALNLRDKGCRVQGCYRPPSDCDAHHIIHWLNGGPTDLNNLILLCRGHHTRRHKGDLTITAHGHQQFTITKTTPNRRT
jgi:hypothetical protein